MLIIAKVLVALVALEHVFFLIMEMFLWTTPRIRAVFGSTAEFAQATKALAANQGLYNGFLAAGLIWGLFYPVAAVSHNILIFFVACVLVAGIFGGFTAKRSILLVQGLPALLALVALLLS
jgi:putative membrane protein